MISETFSAMGTTVEVVAERSEAVAEVGSVFSELEARLSRFIPGSELSQLNDDPAARVGVSAEFASVLRAAADLRDQTEGLVDPAVGPSVVAWGYDRTFEEVDAGGESPSQQWPGNWSIENRVVRREPGVRFDLGGIGKGWAADRAIETTAALVVSAGGDVRSRHPSARVDIVDPWGKRPVTVRLGGAALATSSITRRRWSLGGHSAHHIIDPRTGDPADTPVLSATVRCRSAVEAEAGAKAVLIRGEGGLAWASMQPWIDAAMVVWADGSVYATTGWEVAA